MLLAATDGTPFKLVLVLHILTVLVAFLPVAHALLTMQSRSSAGGGSSMMATMLANNRKVYAPALVLSGLFGMALVGMSDSEYSFSQAWVSIAFLVWIAMNGVLHGVIVRNEGKAAAGDQHAAAQAELGAGILTVLFVIMLVVMIFRPGA